MKVSLYRLKDGDKFYIGSTTQPLNIRLNEHRCHKKGELKNIENWGAVVIELIEAFDCDTAEERYKRETVEINKYLGGALCMNRRRPHITREDRKIQLKGYTEYRKTYWEQNKDKINASRNIKVDCVCGKEISKANLRKHLRVACSGGSGGMEAEC
jgi:hypothetical protein